MRLHGRGQLFIAKLTAYIKNKGKHSIIVSLTSIVVKLLESLLREFLTNHFMKNHLFADEQHGFLPGRSCTTQLLVATEKWSKFLNESWISERHSIPFLTRDC